jgi:Putative Flp pilus-assembly TadE/G-like
MQRLKGDSGAVGVMFAVLLVPLLVVTALVVDIGAAYVERRELQNASDAAALAIALDCGRGSCGNVAATATTLLAGNVGTDNATAAPTISGNSVTVHTSSTIPYRFAAVVGFDNTTVTASSTASWGAPSAGMSLPLAFSWCSFMAQTGGGLPTGSVPVTIYQPKTDDTTCTSQSGNPVPGGFGWLTTMPGKCSAATGITIAQVFSDPGRSKPSVCSLADFTGIHGKTILLPVFDKFGGTGSSAWYHIYAYAAFRVTGYSFGGQYKWNAPCGGNDSCIQGYFTKFVGNPLSFTYSSTAPDLGGRIVKLVA